MNKYLAAIILTLPLVFASCSGTASPNRATGNANIDAEKSDEKSKKKDKDTDESANANVSTAEVSQCDKSLWDRVYNSERLEIKEQCKIVTGTIAERNADDDGDEHMLLRLDAGQDDLLTKKNEKKKDGNLVIEAVCVNPTNLKKVGDTCNGFKSPVSLPQVGDHVRVTGSYVIDSNNGWSEIHPITRIDRMQ